jgi:hypothetical protein
MGSSNISSSIHQQLYSQEKKVYFLYTQPVFFHSFIPQVDLSLEMITYGSEEDLVRGKHPGGRLLLLRGAPGPPPLHRRGTTASIIGCTRSSCTSTGSGSNGSSSSSNGGPTTYSREEFKEQYCVTGKELEALELARRRRGLFNCLSNKQESSCSRGSLLSSCVKRKNYEECIDEDKRPYVKLKPTSEWRGAMEESGGGSSGATSAGGGLSRGMYESVRSGTPINDEDAESYFRRRPKTICLSDPRRFQYQASTFSGVGGIRLVSGL